MTQGENSADNTPEKAGLLPDDVNNHNNPRIIDSSKDPELNRQTKTLLTEKEAPSKAPTDRWRAVYLILVLNGVATLMPWNMFITAQPYFTDYKLNTNTSMKAEYRNNFLSYVGIAAQLPNLLLNAINLFAQCGRGSLSLRIIVSIVTVLLMFIVTVILAMVDSYDWPELFFIITIITVVIINMANGVYQNCVYGLAACLPMKYTNAVVLGSNLSGTVTAAVAIISIAASPDPRTAAIYYFLTAIFVLLVAFDSYFALPLIPFYKHYKQLQKQAHQEEMAEKGQARQGLPPYWTIFKQCWIQLISVFLVFFVTLTCFPAIQALIKPLDTVSWLPDKYFGPVFCFLSFNFFAMVGNLCTEFIKFPGPRWLWLPVVLRLLFIPFFVLCNYKPETRGFPVYIANDYVYIVGGIIMAFTSGYYSSLGMMYAPSKVEQPQHRGIAGMMGAFFLIFGIFMGVQFSLVVAKIVDAVAISPTQSPMINITSINGTGYDILTSPTTL